MLIDELKELAQRGAQSTTIMPKPEGMASFIEKIKNLAAFLKARIESLRSGSAAASQQIGGI